MARKCQTGPRKLSATPSARAGAGRQGNGERGVRHCGEEVAGDADALDDFGETDADARGDVAVGFHRHAEAEMFIGCVAGAAACVLVLARGAADDAAGGIGLGEVWGDEAGADEAVLQAGIILENSGQAWEFGLQGIKCTAGWRPRRWRRMSLATPPGMMHVHHQPVAEGGMGGDAEGFALPGEAGLQEGEAGIARDVPDIGGVIGQALDLGHDGAEMIGCARAG